MDINVFPHQELMPVLSALRHVAVANDRFSDAERALIEGVARIHGLELSSDELEPVSYDQLARVVQHPHRRKRAVQLAIVTALVEGRPQDETDRAVRELATALDIDEAGVRVLDEVTHGHAVLARVDMIRRVSRFIRNADEFPGFLRFVLPLLGVGDGDPELAARYRALGACRSGSLGRAFFDFLYGNDFSFPGEPGGIPMVFHDLGHVLSGYGTDPQGEIQQAAFQAGFARRDGFAFLLFGILQFHLEMRITPVAKGHRNLFDVPRVLRALERGASCKVDLTQGFDLLANKNRSLEAVRAELGIPPLETTALAS